MKLRHRKRARIREEIINAEKWWHIWNSEDEPNVLAVPSLPELEEEEETKEERCR